MHRNKQGSNQRQGRSMDDLYQCHQQAHRDVGWNGVGKLLHRVFLALVSLIHRPAQHPDSFDTMQREQKLRGAMRIQVVHAQQSSLVFDTLPMSLLRGLPPAPLSSSPPSGLIEPWLWRLLWLPGSPHKQRIRSQRGFARNLFSMVDDACTR